MLRKILFFMAGIFFVFSANVSAAPVNVSDDNVQTFMEKCNTALKAGDQNSFLDMPSLSSELYGLKNYVDKSIKTESNVPIRITYSVKDDKIFSVLLDAGKYDDEVKNYFDGLSILFLKSLGLTDDESKNLLNEKNEMTWQREGFISRLNKKIVVRFVSRSLIIFAEDK